MKIIDPNVEVPDIEVQIDTNIEEPVDNIIKHWGPRIPVVSVNDIAIPLGKVKSYSLSIGINRLPSFTLVINDNNQNFRDSLNDDIIDTCVIFIGEKRWYRKYQGVILNSYNSGDSTILSGILYNPKFYETVQESFKNKTVKDVLTEMCSKMDMGLFLFEDNNTDLTKTFNSINPGTRRINYLLEYISKYTNNIICIDDSYFLHIGNIETMKNQEVDKFTIKNGRFFDEPKPIILTNLLFQDDTVEEFDNFQLVYNNINVDKNTGNSHIRYSKKYHLNSDILLPTLNSELGLGESYSNTFKPFEDRYSPYYKERLDRDMSGKTINLKMQDNLLEISPFQVIDLRVYKSDEVDAEGNSVLDEKHSGKKIIIAYDESYSIENDSDNKYIQNITVI